MKKNEMNTAKVNKEIGGWDYKGFHIDRIKKTKEHKGCIIAKSEELKVSFEAADLKTAKIGIDSVLEQKAKEAEDEEAKRKAALIATYTKRKDDEIEFISKRGIHYLLTVKDGVIRAFTYENDKKAFWNVTKEMRVFVASL